MDSKADSKKGKDESFGGHFFDSSDDSGDSDEDFDMGEYAQHMFAKQSRRWMTLNTRDPWDEKIEEHLRSLDKALPSAQPLLDSSYVLHVQLCNVHPRMWRRVRVPGSMTLHSLADKVLCPVIGFRRNYHAWFFIGLPRPSQRGRKPWDYDLGLVYGPVGSGAVDMMHLGTHGLHMVDDKKVRVGQWLQRVGQKVEWTYDIGDMFRFKLRVESIEGAAPGRDNAVIELLAGECMGPPEDCGSSRSFAELLQKLSADPRSAEYREAQHKVHSAANYLDRHVFDYVKSFKLSEARKRLAAAIQSKASPMDDSNFTVDLMGGGYPRFPAAESFQPTPSFARVCPVCSQAADMKCSRCRAVYYCSREHQKADWKAHKRMCAKEVFAEGEQQPGRWFRPTASAAASPASKGAAAAGADAEDAEGGGGSSERQQHQSQSAMPPATRSAGAPAGLRKGFFG